MRLDSKLEGQSCVRTAILGTTKYKRYNESAKGKARLARRNAARKAQRELDRKERIENNAARSLDPYGSYSGSKLGLGKTTVGKASGIKSATQLGASYRIEHGVNFKVQGTHRLTPETFQWWNIRLEVLLTKALTAAGAE
jgi:hypothetical protein